MYEKVAHIRLYEKRYNFETEQICWLKIWHGDFKNVLLIMLKFQT